MGGCLGTGQVEEQLLGKPKAIAEGVSKHATADRAVFLTPPGDSNRTVNHIYATSPSYFLHMHCRSRDYATSSEAESDGYFPTKVITDRVDVGVCFPIYHSQTHHCRTARSHLEARQGVFAGSQRAAASWCFVSGNRHLSDRTPACSRVAHRPRDGPSFLFRIVTKNNAIPPGPSMPLHLCLGIKRLHWILQSSSQLKAGE